MERIVDVRFKYLKDLVSKGEDLELAYSMLSLNCDLKFELLKELVESNNYTLKEAFEIVDKNRFTILEGIHENYCLAKMAILEDEVDTFITKEMIKDFNYDDNDQLKDEIKEELYRIIEEMKSKGWCTTDKGFSYLINDELDDLDNIN